MKAVCLSQRVTRHERLMGEIHEPTSALLLIAVCSRHDSAIAWSEQRCVSELGPLALKSESFRFTETDYYQKTMGAGLKKQFLAFKSLIDPSTLPRIKRLANEWEAACAVELGHPEARPLNLDPGYLTLAKLVLASTKDHSHRIYVGQGIYAEVTLNYRGHGWHANEWTYPDYRRKDYQEFFTRCRQAVRGPAV